MINPINAPVNIELEEGSWTITVLLDHFRGNVRLDKALRGPSDYTILSSIAHN
jgi:hypothetical protein